MKIFEIIYKDGEQQWVAAATNIEALLEVLSVESTDLDLMQEIKEFPESEWDEMKVVNVDESEGEKWETMSFREFLNRCTSSKIIAGTFYDF
jgi:hypothetical protein